MADTSAQAVRQLVQQASMGDEKAASALMPIVYDELRRLAHAYMGRERPGQTIQATALVHEAYLRLLKDKKQAWQGRTHFLAIAAVSMRQILVERARARGAMKRGGGKVRVTLNEGAVGDADPEVDVLAIDAALTRLAEVDPQLARIVELRFFGGLTIGEAAEALGISPATVKRGWTLAKAWLRREVLEGEGGRMDPERWRRINELFHAALDREPEEREAFLHSACGEDSELIVEVESLLHSHGQADEFIEVPAFESAAHLLEVEADESLVGQQLGPYKVEEKIGQGGMGVVYLAEDTRLGRRVAIKALPSNLTRDERSRERLRREARAAATVSHPGIATVHSLEEVDDHLYIVYEHVPGRTLREELVEGPMPADRVVSTILAIARAVEAAHEQGIIHRDLKPENVIRVPGGSTKVLDLGLAAFETNPMQGEAAGPRLTIPGMLIGTPAYMSPEQLRNEDVDHRADIFALGVMVYELATASNPFLREDPASTIASILETEPTELYKLAGGISPELSRIATRCLHKNRNERYERTSDLVRDLEQLESIDREAEHGSEQIVRDQPDVWVDQEPGLSAEMVSPPRYSPLWWWRFHQIVVGISYYTMLVPLWLVKKWTEGGEAAAWGSAIFFIALVPVGVAGILRIHLWFTSRYYPTELSHQRRRAALWIHFADALFVALLLSGAYLIAVSRAATATLLVAFAVGFLISATMIEPTTSRAAFPREDGNGSP